jgi:hypothetical protein
LFTVTSYSSEDITLTANMVPSTLLLLLLLDDCCPAPLPLLLPCSTSFTVTGCAQPRRLQLPAVQPLN